MKSLFTKPQMRVGMVRSHNEGGFTLVEMLVAIALSTVIALAAVAALIVARQGFATVDASSQVRDNGRYAIDIIKRMVVQAGYQDVVFATKTREGEFPVPPGAVVNIPYVTGADNAVVLTSTLPDITTAYKLRTTATVGELKCTSGSDTACANGSDVLILRYQTSPQNSGGTVSDQSMINCAGFSNDPVPAVVTDRVVSILHVAVGANGEEPSLMCSYFSPTSLTWVTQPILSGVESFQVLYGVDGYNNGNNLQFTGPQDTVPDRYLRASQMVVGAADSTATYSNWRRVRSIRIGLILRGPVNSNAVKGGNLTKLCPLGYDTTTTTDCVDESSGSGTAMGSELPRKGSTVADDGRLRQVLTFTVYLRNVQIQN
jgi:type IV pilus assembly protein PilW